MTPEESAAVSDPLWNRLHNAARAPARDDGFSYERLLRCAGQYFDTHGAVRIHVLEVIDGFSVRYQTARDTADSETAHLTRGNLEQISQDLEVRRKRVTFHFGKRSGGTTYEDTMRALGYELDCVRAYSLLVDELDEGLVVTYQFLKPSEGFNVRKRMVILGQEALRAVVEDAHTRREKRARGVLSLLAG